MMKRIVYRAVYLSLAALFFSVPWLFAQQTTSSTATTETINLSTYYPAPFGAYDTFRLVPKASGFVPPNPCTLGTMYVNSNGKLQVCRSVGGTPTWGPADQVWTQSGNNIYPADTASMVGIGTTNPIISLGKGLDVHGNIYIHMSPSDAGLAFGDDNPVNTKWNIKYWNPSIMPPNGGLVFSETGVAYHILTLKAGGKVGIGVSSPNARLDIKGVGKDVATFGLGIRNSADQYSLIVRDDGKVGIGVNPSTALEVGGMTKTTGGLVIETRRGSPPSSPLTGQMWIQFPIVCGDGFCDPGETCATCKQDCGCCPVDGGWSFSCIAGRWHYVCDNPPVSCGGANCPGCIGPLCPYESDGGPCGGSPPPPPPPPPPPSASCSCSWQPLDTKCHTSICQARYDIKAFYCVCNPSGCGGAVGSCVEPPGNGPGDYPNLWAGSYSEGDQICRVDSRCYTDVSCSGGTAYWLQQGCGRSCLPHTDWMEGQCTCLSGINCGCRGMVGGLGAFGPNNDCYLRGYLTCDAQPNNGCQ